MSSRLRIFQKEDYLNLETVVKTKDGAPVQYDSRSKSNVSGNNIQLVLDNVQKKDSGIYTLKARSPKGLYTKTFELRVNEDDFNEPPTFLRQLNDLSVKSALIEWLHNDLQIVEGDRFKFLSEGDYYCIDVNSIIPQDAGRWSCVASNIAGQSNSSCHLNILIPKIYKPPVFLEELRALLTDQGTVSLECKVVGVPTPLLRWFKDGKEIKAGDVFALEANANDPTSLGTYVCEATNCMGKAYSSSKVHVTPEKGERSVAPTETSLLTGTPPIFIEELKDFSIKIGDPLNLSCQVLVPPWPKCVQWYNSGGRIDDEEHQNRYKKTCDGLGTYAIEAKPTEAVDQGEWKCVTTNTDGGTAITKCNVKMTIPKRFRKPRFMDSLKAILTEEGLVSFECKVVGSPTPLLLWYKDGQELKPGDVYQLTGTNSLGSYCCIARNCMGEARSTAELTIEDIQNQLNDDEKMQLLSKNQAPKFLQGLKSSEVKINDYFRFTVQVSTLPVPSLFWFRDDQAVDSDCERYNVIKENFGICHLDILRLEFLDQAEWKCVATNDYGQSVTSCFLKLLIPKHYKMPKFLESLRAVLSEEGAVNLECKVIGVPQPILKWYKDGQELKPGDIHKITSGEDGTCCLGTYTCEARNCMGTVASSASLLGFEDQPKPKRDQHVELARQPSLSTIHEERTSQLYDTPQEDISIVLGDRADISFSFDGKEVSVSLYETPDLTEEEAIQIVEMYADQLSEHVSEHSIIELPPLRFTKESSNSGNLLIEAVLIDVSEEYFATVEEDLRTDQSQPPVRPPRKKNDSLRSNTYYSLSKNDSVESEIEEGSLSGQVDLDSRSYAYVSAKDSIAETKSLTDDFERQPLSPQTTHEIGSDLRVNQLITDEDSKSLRESIKDMENKINILSLDVQGEEEDGLRGEKNTELRLDTLRNRETELCKLLQQNLEFVQLELADVEQNLPQKPTTKPTQTRSLEVIQSLVQPVRDIQTCLVAWFEDCSRLSIIELIAPSIFELQKNLKIVEKCLEFLGKEHTVIQQTCNNIVNKTQENMLGSLKLLENIILLEKEQHRTDPAGFPLSDKLVSEILVTLEEMQSDLRMQSKAIHGVDTSSAPFSTSVPETNTAHGMISKLLTIAASIKRELANVAQEIQEKKTTSYATAMGLVQERLESGIESLSSEMQIITKRASRPSIRKKSVIQEVCIALADQIVNPIYELIKNLDLIKQRVHTEKQNEVVDEDVLKPFVVPIEEIIYSLEKIQKHIPLNETEFETETTTSPTHDIVKDILEHLTNIVVQNMSRSLEELLWNIEEVQKQTLDPSILEVLRQLTTLQREFNSTLRKSSLIKTEAALSALDILSRPIDLLNNRILDLSTDQTLDALEDLVADLNILEESIDVDKNATGDEGVFYNHLLLIKGRSKEIREHIKDMCETTENAPKKTLKPIREDVGFKNEVMHEESVEEIEDTETLAPFNQFAQIQNQIVTVQNLPFMQNLSGAISTSPEVFIEPVLQLQSYIEELKVETVGDDKIQQELQQNASEVIQCIEKVKILSNEQVAENVSQDVVLDVSKMSESLTKLHRSISNIQKEDENKSCLFNCLENTVRGIKSSVDQLKLQDVLEESFRDVFEILSIERNNVDWTESDLKGLELINSNLQVLADKTPESFVNDLDNVLLELAPKEGTPINSVILNIKQLLNKTKILITQETQEVKFPFSQVYKAVKQLEKNATLLNIFSVSENCLTELYSTVRKAKVAVKSVNRDARIKQKEFCLYNDVAVVLVSISKSIEKASKVQEETSEELPMGILEKTKPSVKMFKILVEDLQHLSSFNELTKSFGLLGNGLDDIFESLSLTEPNLNETYVKKMEDLNERLRIVVQKPELTKKEVIAVLEQCNYTLQKLVEYCRVNEILNDEAACLETATNFLNVLCTSIESKMPIELLKNSGKNLENYLHKNLSFNSVLEPFVMTCLNAVDILEQNEKVQRENHASKAQVLESLSESIQALLKNIALVNNAQTSELQKYLYSLQMSSNDLLDVELSKDDQDEVIKSSRLLMEVDKYILSKSGKFKDQDPMSKEKLLEMFTSTKENLKKYPSINVIAYPIHNISLIMPDLLNQLDSTKDFILTHLNNILDILKLIVIANTEEKLELNKDLQAALKAFRDNLDTTATDTTLTKSETGYFRLMQYFTTELQNVVEENSGAALAIKNIDDLNQQMLESTSSLGPTFLPIVDRFAEVFKETLHYLSTIKEDNQNGDNFRGAAVEIQFIKDTFVLLSNKDLENKSALLLEVHNTLINLQNLLISLPSERNLSAEENQYAQLLLNYLQHLDLVLTQNVHKSQLFQLQQDIQLICIKLPTLIANYFKPEPIEDTNLNEDGVEVEIHPIIQILERTFENIAVSLNKLCEQDISDEKRSQIENIELCISELKSNLPYISYQIDLNAHLEKLSEISAVTVQNIEQSIEELNLLKSILGSISPVRNIIQPIQDIAKAITEIMQPTAEVTPIQAIALSIENLQRSLAKFQRNINEKETQATILETVKNLAGLLEDCFDITYSLSEEELNSLQLIENILNDLNWRLADFKNRHSEDDLSETFESLVKVESNLTKSSLNKIINKSLVIVRSIDFILNNNRRKQKEKLRHYLELFKESLTVLKQRYELTDCAIEDLQATVVENMILLKQSSSKEDNCLEESLEILQGLGKIASDVDEEQHSIKKKIKDSKKYFSILPEESRVRKILKHVHSTAKEALDCIYIHASHKNNVNSVISSLDDLTDKLDADTNSELLKTIEKLKSMTSKLAVNVGIEYVLKDVTQTLKMLNSGREEEIGISLENLKASAKASGNVEIEPIVLLVENMVQNLTKKDEDYKLKRIKQVLDEFSSSIEQAKNLPHYRNKLRTLDQVHCVADGLKVVAIEKLSDEAVETIEVKIKDIIQNLLEQEPGEHTQEYIKEYLNAIISCAAPSCSELAQNIGNLIPLIESICNPDVSYTFQDQFHTIVQNLTAWRCIWSSNKLIVLELPRNLQRISDEIEKFDLADQMRVGKLFEPLADITATLSNDQDCVKLQPFVQSLKTCSTTNLEAVLEQLQDIIKLIESAVTEAETKTYWKTMRQGIDYRSLDSVKKYLEVTDPQHPLTASVDTISNESEETLASNIKVQEMQIMENKKEPESSIQFKDKILEQLQKEVEQFLHTIDLLKQSKTELNVFKELENPLNELLGNILISKSDRLLDDQVKIIQNITESFANFIKSAHSAVTINDLSDQLTSVHDTVVAVCTKTVIGEISPAGESVLQILTEPLENMGKAIIDIKIQCTERDAIVTVIKSHAETLSSCLHILEKLHKKEKGLSKKLKPYQI
ncbi:hypothetical protein FQR65_LT04739 [Abscondita terminalis]|nr:hypothetical protein FQR65_LT04739 [Abscondita terminalis]